MTERDVVASAEMPDGTEYRVRLEADTDAGRPEDDGQWPILQLYYNNRYGWEAEAFNEQGKPYWEAFNRLKEGGHVTETFERYVTIFHGAGRVVTYGPNQMTDYTYVAFNPTAWREAMGIPLDRDMADEEPLAEIQAWIEGDVWGWIAEYRNNVSGIADEEDWIDDESVWGFYGRQYAEEAAREQLQAMVDNHKAEERRGRWGAELIRRKLGGKLQASMTTHTSPDGEVVLTTSLGPVEVNIYTAPDGAMVVTIDSPTQSDSEHPTLRVHLNDETIYNASEESIETPETEGDN
jgi:hypothetical protein